MLIKNKIFADLKWIVLLVFCITVSCGNKADYHNKEGLYLYNKRKFDEAITEFKKALELNQKHYDAHFNLGIVYYAQNMHDESIAELKKTIQLNPKSEKAHSILLAIYDKLGNTEGVFEENRILKQLEMERRER